MTSLWRTSTGVSHRNKILLTLRVLLGATLLIAACAKATNLLDFERSLSVAHLSNPTSAPLLAAVVLVAEAAVGLGLIVKSEPRIIEGALLLGSGFVGYALWRIVGKVEAPCNCFGPLLAATPLQSLGLAAVFVTFATMLRRHAAASPTKVSP